MSRREVKTVCCDREWGITQGLLGYEEMELTNVVGLGSRLWVVRPDPRLLGLFLHLRGARYSLQSPNGGFPKASYLQTRR